MSYWHIYFVLSHCRTLPLLVLHRKNWDIVYPRLELEEAELVDLSERGTYVAGFTDSTVEGRTDLYDLFVNGEIFALFVATFKLIPVYCLDYSNQIFGSFLQGQCINETS